MKKGLWMSGTALQHNVVDARGDMYLKAGGGLSPDTLQLMHR
jgi:hypothetical protein